MNNREVSQMIESINPDEVCHIKCKQRKQLQAQLKLEKQKNEKLIEALKSVEHSHRIYEQEWESYQTSEIVDKTLKEIKEMG